MARTLLPVVGGAVGGFFGGPMGAQMGFALGSVLGNVVDPVKIKGPSIGDVGAQTSAEGAPRAIVYGTAPVTGNVISCGELVRRWVKQRGGGKGAPKVRTEHVYRTFAIRICEGPIAGVLRVWEDDKLVYDVRPSSPILAESAKWIANKTIYLGTEEQLPDPVLQAQVSGADDTPAYRGTAYFVVDSEDLTERRGSIPQYRFEAATETLDVPLPWIDDVNVYARLSGAVGPVNESNTPSLTGPSEVWFVALLARSSVPAPGEFTFSVLVAGDEIWSEKVEASAQWQFKRLQLNLPAGSTVQLRIVGGADGNVHGGQNHLQWKVVRPDSSGAASSYPPGGHNPTFYTPDNPFFGVIVDGDDLYSAEKVGMPAGEAPNFLDWGSGFLPVVGPVPAVLSEVVADIIDRCGIDDDLAEVSELTDDVPGLVLSGDYSGADAIDVLRRVYFFDRSEHDGKIHLRKRGKPVVEVLTIDDLVEDTESSTREQAIEYPAKLHLFYQHAASGYARVKATAQRSSPDARVVGETSVEVPVVLDEDTAAQIAHKMHKVAWADAEGETKLSLPESFIRLAAADCVGLSLRGRVRRLRIEEMRLADGRVELTARVDRQSAYTSAVTGIPLPTPTPPPGTIVGATVLAVLDIPSRIDSEDDLNLYLAVSAVEQAWYGALVERSLDAGATYVDAEQIERSMVIGVLTADLPAASAHYTDTTNRVRLRLYRASHDLESITEQAFLSGGGAFAVRSPDGAWEILQYLDAEDLGDQEYELSTLHRGRLATTPAAHPIGSLVVFLDDVEHVSAQAAWIGQQLTHRATSFGETPETATDQTMTYAGRSQLEWPVAYLMLERDSNDVISGTWTPRHRFGSDDFPVASINFEGYRVTIDDGSTGVVLDTVDPHFSFDASALAAPVTVSVAALNRITGAGPATVDTV